MSDGDRDKEACAHQITYARESVYIYRGLPAFFLNIRTEPFRRHVAHVARFRVCSALCEPARGGFADNAKTEIR
jgi:hypothetical protein